MKANGYQKASKLVHLSNSTTQHSQRIRPQTETALAQNMLH